MTPRGSSGGDRCWRPRCIVSLRLGEEQLVRPLVDSRRTGISAAKHRHPALESPRARARPPAFDRWDTAAAEPSYGTRSGGRDRRRRRGMPPDDCGEDPGGPAVGHRLRPARPRRIAGGDCARAGAADARPAPRLRPTAPCAPGTVPRRCRGPRCPRCPAGRGGPPCGRTNRLRVCGADAERGRGCPAAGSCAGRRGASGGPARTGAESQRRRGTERDLRPGACGHGCGSSTAGSHSSGAGAGARQAAMTPIEAMQTTLAGEHAAVYVYGVVGGRTAAAQQPEQAARVAQAYTVPRSRRDQLTAMVRRAGGRPVASEVSYELGNAARTGAQLMAIARQVETRSAEVYAQLVANTSGATRQRAVDALVDAAVRGLGLGRTPQAFPGAPRL